MGHALEDGVHVVAPDGLRGVLRGGNGALVVHADVGVGVAAPDDGGELRGEAAEPEVLGVVGGAGLAGDGLVAREVAGDVVAGVAAGDDALEDVDGGLGHGALERLLIGVLVLVDHLAGARLDLGDGHCVVVHAVGWQGGVGLAHLQRRDGHGAQGDGQVGLQGGVQAHGVGGVDDGVGADGLGHLSVGGVGRDGRGGGEATGAVVVLAVVADRPGGRDGHRGAAVEHDVGVHALADGGDKGKRLERGAGLARGLGGQVELLGLVVGAADQSLDVAVGVVDGDQGAVDAVVAGGVDAVGHGLLRGLLVVRVKGGVDLEAALEDGVGVKVLEQQALHVVGEVGVLAHGVHQRAQVEVDLLGLGGAALLLGDVTGLKHALQNEVAPVLAALGVARGVVVGGGVGQAHQRGGLGQGKLVGVLVEVDGARGLDAVGTVAVVDGVEVHVKDLLLGVRLLHLDGNEGLADLALEGHLKLFIGEHGVSHQLLRDGGAAAGVIAGDLAHHGAQDALGVDAVVRVEALVLGVHGALHHVLRDVADVHGTTGLQVVGRNLVALGVIDARGLRHQVGVGGGVVGQVLQPGRHHAAKRHDEGEGEKRHEANGAGDAKAGDMGL